MKRTTKMILLSLLILGLGSPQAFGRPGRKSRVDFDDMMIRGQTKRADTLYIFERGSSKQETLTSPRKDYRKEIIRTMFK